MQDINLKTELEKAQEDYQQNVVLKQAEALLNADVNEEVRISSNIKTARKLAAEPRLNQIDALDPTLIYNVEAIENICTKFRLRFLESALFKGQVPAEAIRKVKRIESATGVRFTKYRIIAPAERFRLKDSTKDPILLAELPNGKYYYIYQWGNDMDWKERFLKYPFQHMGALVTTGLAIGLVIALIVPSQFSDFKAEFFYRFFMFSMSSALIVTLAIIVGIMYSKDFSENVWNSKFLK